jgi:antitoxin MazE
MTTKIQKWGNSLGIRLPKALIESTSFSEGAEVIFSQKGAEIILKVVKPKYPSLKEIMKGMTRANFEPELDWGPDVGQEIID